MSTHPVYPPDPPPPRPPEDSPVELIYRGGVKAIPVRAVSGVLGGIDDVYRSVGGGASVLYSASDYENSFRLQLNVHHQPVQKALFSETSPTELLFGSEGVLTLIHRLDRRRIVAFSQADESVSVTLDNQESLPVPKYMFGLLYSDAFRKSLRRILEPIDSANDVSSLEILVGDETDQRRFEYTPADKEYLGSPIVRADDEVESLRTTMEVVSPTFKDGKKWRMLVRGTSEWVSVADDGYWEQVSRGLQRFAKGDLLDADISVKRGSKGRPSYVITKVHAHKHIETQGELSL